MKCKSCKKEVARVKSGKKIFGNLDRYADGNGNMWKGKDCPQCVAEEDRLIPKRKKVIRNCRGCGKKLSEQRYFNCYICVESRDIGGDDGNLVYMESL